MLHSPVSCPEMKYWPFVICMTLFLRFDIAFREHLTFNSNQRRTVNGSESPKMGRRVISRNCVSGAVIGQMSGGGDLSEVSCWVRADPASQTTPPDEPLNVAQRFRSGSMEELYYEQNWTGGPDSLLWACFVGRGVNYMYCTGPPKHAGKCTNHITRGNEFYVNFMLH